MYFQVMASKWMTGACFIIILGLVMDLEEVSSNRHKNHWRSHLRGRSNYFNRSRAGIPPWGIVGIVCAVLFILGMCFYLTVYFCIG